MADERDSDLPDGVYQYPSGAWALMVHRARARQVVPFVGAGISASVLPTWWATLVAVYDRAYRRGDDDKTFQELVDACGVQRCECGRAQGDMAMATEVMRARKPKRVFRETAFAVFEEKVRAVVKSILTSPGNLRTSLAYEWLPQDVLDDEDAMARLRELPFEECHAELAPMADAAIAGMSPRQARAVLCAGRWHWSPWNNREEEWRGLHAHCSIVSGPWPCIMTTNWDDLLESAWATLDSAKTASGRRAEEVRRGQEELPVRYRADVAQAFAELKAGARVPALYKLHGDFSKRGTPEFVGGHADYRKLMTRDVASLQFMRYVSANFSLLFYGASLEDKDLLACLDDIVETLGAEVGPHFFLTADDVKPERAEYLFRHYAIHTIRAPVRQFGVLGQMLNTLCRKAFSLPCGLNFSGSRYSIKAGDGGGEGAGVAVNVRVERRFWATPDVIPRVAVPGVYVAHGVTATCDVTSDRAVDGIVYVGWLLASTFAHEADMFDPTHGLCPRYDRRRSNWRAMRYPAEILEGTRKSSLRVYWGDTKTIDALWLVMPHAGYVPPSDASPCLTTHGGRQRRSTWLATWHTLANILHEALSIDMPSAPPYLDLSDEDSAADGRSRDSLQAALRGEGIDGSRLPSGSIVGEAADDGERRYAGGLSEVRIFLPVLATGIGHLHSHEALSAMLSAIGSFTRTLQRSGYALPTVSVTICVVDADLLSSLEAGRYQVGAVIGRALEGWLKFQCVYRHASVGWHARQVRLPMHSATFGDLERYLGCLGLLDGDGAPPRDHLLLAYGVTEGSVLKIVCDEGAVRVSGVGDASPAAGAAAPAGAAGGAGGGAAGRDGDSGAAAAVAALHAPEAPPIMTRIASMSTYVSPTAAPELPC